MKMELSSRMLLLIFLFGMVSRSFIKSTFGSNASIVLLVIIALFYYNARQREQERSVYDDILEKQDQAHAKLLALEGKGDEAMMSMSMRPTSFKLEPNEISLITERMNKYSSKLGGAPSDRRKFLRRNIRRAYLRNEDGDVVIDDDKNAIPIGSSKDPTRKEQRKQKRMEKLVEDAVDETL